MALIIYPDVIDFDIYFEFDETFNTLYTGREALKKGISWELLVERGVIPYYIGGVDYGLFNYRDEVFLDSLNKLLERFGVRSTIKVDKGRISLVELKIEIPVLEGD